MRSFDKLKLSHRFAILIGVFALGFAVYGAWSIKTLNELKVNGPVYQHIIQGKDLIADILPPPEYIIESYLVSLQLAGAGDKAEQDGLIERLKALKAEYDVRHEFWLKEPLEKELAELFLKQAHEPAVAFYAIAFNEFIPALQKQNKDAGDAAIKKMKQAYETHRKSVDQIVKITTKRIETDEANAKTQIQTDRALLLMIFLISLGISVAAATVIARGLLSSLGGEPGYAVEITRKIAFGDLTSQVNVKEGDQHSLLFAMKSMQEKLSGTMMRIKTAVDSVTSSARQIAAGNLDLSARTEHQASSLEETASSMEELTGTIKQNADHAHQASRLANSASEVAIKGGAVVSHVVETMGSINEASRKIVDIIAVIDSIAFQTNILALNAAVEAARAGEQGRGFAVVATEVRSLAQRSASAAREIKGLIGDSVERVVAGATLVNQAGTTMEEVVASVKRVTDIISEISAASQEQNSGIEQINQAINQMDQVTQQNGALVEEAAAAAESLREQAISLAQVVNTFILEGAHSGTAVATTTVQARRGTEMSDENGIPAAGERRRAPRLDATKETLRRTD